MAYAAKTPGSDVSYDALWNMIRERYEILKDRWPSKKAIDPHWRTLIEKRREYLIEYARLSRQGPHSTPEEKERCREITKRRKRLGAKIRGIEHDVIFYLAKETRHVDIWNPYKFEGRDPLDPTTWSLREQWRVEYLKSQKRPGFRHPKRKAVTRRRTQKRHTLSNNIQDLDYVWLTAFTLIFFKRYELPPRWTVNPRNFRP